jgi:purine-binding chemotaxis protein CheW
VIPLINTFYKFGAKDTATDLFPVIVLFKIRFGGEEVEIAASVTAVRDVLPAEEYPVSLAPELGIKYKPEYIKGMISFNDSMVLLLDIDRVFATEEIIRIIELIETI